MFVSTHFEGRINAQLGICTHCTLKLLIVQVFIMLGCSLCDGADSPDFERQLAFTSERWIDYLENAISLLFFWEKINKIISKTENNKIYLVGLYR